MATRRKPYRILLPLANPRTARDLVRIGAGIRRRRSTEITALGIVEVPEGISLSEGAIQARGARRLLQRVLDFGDQEGVDIRTSVRIGRAAADGIIEAVGEEEADLLIFGWAGPCRDRIGAQEKGPSSRRPSTRWSRSRRATWRSSNSVGSTTCARSWCRFAEDPMRRWPCGWRSISAPVQSEDHGDARRPGEHRPGGGGAGPRSPWIDSSPITRVGAGSARC